MSPLSKANQTSFKKGQLPWNAGKKLPEYMRLKMSAARKGKFQGEEHPQWKGGSRTYYKNIARKLMRNKDRVCYVCGVIGNVEVHHCDGNFKNNVITNLTLMCHSCHLKLHHKVDKNTNKCEWCKAVFQSGRVKSRFCSKKCRDTSYCFNKIARRSHEDKGL